MGSMADEAIRRMEADGIDPNQPAGAAMEGLAPGTDGTQPPTQRPPAGESNTDTAAEPGGTPESIPYARFKEVNDQLRELQGYRQLKDYGYDPDSLGRLAAFEAQYVENPTGTISQLVESLDLPEDRKQQLVKLLSDENSSSEPREPSGSGEGIESEADLDPKSLEVQELLDWKRRQETEAAQRQSTEALEAVVSHWEGLDKEDSVKGPQKRTLLMYVATASRIGGYRTPEDLAKMARQMWLEDRDEYLEGAVVPRGGRAGSPLSVPSGGPPAPEAPKFKDLKDANKAALADIAAGRLPGIPGAK